MRGILRWIGVGIVGLAVVGCADDGDGADDGGVATAIDADAGDDDEAEPNEAPTLQVQIDAAAACGADGTVLLRATLVGCVNPPPAPCTVPNPPRVYDGDAEPCPSDDTAAVLRLAVPQPGRYHAEVVAIAADGSESEGVCWSDGDEADLVVTEEQFDDNPTIELASLGEPCD